MEWIGAAMTQERLLTLFEYHSSGALVAKERRANVMPGTVIYGFSDEYGYRKIRVDGRVYRIHRVIFLLVNGHLPESIDHKDCNKSNNRIENLREATRALNMTNRRPMSKTGFKGVTRNAKSYISRITFNKEQIFLGRFEDPVDAAKAYDTAAIRLYGDYARPNF
jgi:hypothetical protein